MQYELYSRSLKNLARQLSQNSYKSAFTGSQRPICKSGATVGVRGFYENGCMIVFSIYSLKSLLLFSVSNGTDNKGKMLYWAAKCRQHRNCRGPTTPDPDLRVHPPRPRLGGFAHATQPADSLLRIASSTNHRGRARNVGRLTPRSGRPRWPSNQSPASALFHSAVGSRLARAGPAQAPAPPPPSDTLAQTLPCLAGRRRRAGC